MLVNEWHGQSHASAYYSESGHGFRFGIRAWTEMKVWCVKSMFMLKLGSEKNVGFNSFIIYVCTIKVYFIDNGTLAASQELMGSKIQL